MDAIDRLEAWCNAVPGDDRSYAIRRTVIELWGNRFEPWEIGDVVVVYTRKPVGRSYSTPLAPTQRCVSGTLAERINAALDLWEELYPCSK